MKLGIVFGSGAARGWAHIGIMNELHKMGIKPHVVTGTSIGSLVGAALAAGRLEELESWVRGLTNWQVLGLLDWGLGKGGLVSGQRVFDKVAQTIGGLTFDQLDIPFGAVATNLETGREAWLTQGEVKSAIRCSCAIPGLLAPARHQDQWLVDGATVNPIPVSLCRALGADFVIAVDLNSDKSHKVVRRIENEARNRKAKEQRLQEIEKEQNELEEENQQRNAFARLLSSSKEYLHQVAERPKEDKAPGVFAVMAGCIDIMQDKITRSRLAGEPPDILLQPKVGSFGIMEFHRASEIIAEGERCVAVSRNMLEYELEHFSHTLSEFADE
ncbi:patatin-like phospholipase RssA [Alteromonas sp. a30]|uniref:patatin-like phospholipase RssA n=1 Tax=Alteromonas sp. a30 TaxID=2730917 RepID=UPI00228162F2|nr:patatin-like phospholipase RssA [Alteromonas sp. a30]